MDTAALIVRRGSGGSGADGPEPYRVTRAASHTQAPHGLARSGRSRMFSIRST